MGYLKALYLERLILHTNTLSLKKKEKKEYWQVAKNKKIEARLQLLFLIVELIFSCM